MQMVGIQNTRDLLGIRCFLGFGIIGYIALNMLNFILIEAERAL